MRAIHTDKRKSGISPIGDLSWGTHICLFYQAKKDLLEIPVPYFRAGLEGNEFCVWVTSMPLGAEDAKKAMEKAVPHFEKYQEKGQMEIIPYDGWHARGGKSGRAIVSRLDHAISRGFDGLRLAYTVFPEKKGGKVSASYKETDAISRYNVVAVFGYPRDQFDAIGLMEVVKNHRFAIVRNAGRWEVIESSEARMAKDALRRSEEKLHSLFSNMAEGFAYHRIILDGRGKPCDYIFLEVNDAFERLTGLRKENIIGKRATEALPGLEKESTDWIGKYGKVALSGKPMRFESYSEPLKRWYSISAFSPHKGYFAVTFSDITERKNFENELVKAKTEWERTFDSVPDLITILDSSHRILRVNRAMAERLGLEPQRCIGVKCYEAVHGRKEPIATCPHSRSTLDGREHIGEVHEPRLGGDFLVSTTPMHDANGKLLGCVHIARDITERKKAEEALRESEERWATTLASIGDAVISTDVEGRITFMNGMAEALTGWRLAEASTRTVTEVFNIINEETRREVDNPVTQVLLEERVIGLANHTVLLRKDGTEVPIDDSGAPIKDRDGKTVGVVLVFRDITERKQAEENIRRQNKIQESINQIFQKALTCDTEEELGRMCLTVVEGLTGSKFGSIGEIGQDGHLHDIAISDPGWELCTMYDKTGHRRPPGDFKLHGLYGRVLQEGKSLLTNDPASHPDSIGVPEGHPHLTAFLGVPFVQEGKTIGMVAVGNREGGYTEEEQRDLEAVAPAILQAHLRKRAEEDVRQRTLELQELTDTLERRVRERTTELEKANEALRDLSSTLLSAHEEERKRIAGEIHDVIGASMGAIRYKIEGALQQIGETAPDTTKSLMTIMPFVQEGIEECRRIQQDLRPSLLDDLGLLPTLSWFFRRFQTIYSTIQIEQEISIEEHEIPNALKIVIYRVTQEATNNIAKHAKADRVGLSLRKSDDRIELILQDNGRGFDPGKVLNSKSARRGLGLTSMRERAELSGGTFDIESMEGKGVVIHASWPLEYVNSTETHTST